MRSDSIQKVNINTAEKLNLVLYRPGSDHVLFKSSSITLILQIINIIMHTERLTEILSKFDNDIREIALHSQSSLEVKTNSNTHHILMKCTGKLRLCILATYSANLVALIWEMNKLANEKCSFD